MKRKIGIKELHSMASQMKYYDFENWIAKELFGQPKTVDTIELTDKLFLHNVVGQSGNLVCKGRCDHGYKDEYGNELFCSIKNAN